MMNNASIQILPEELCNKIAAGEVVERPSSVVKELLENAIDAGANEILIELRGGGKTLVSVADNGCGMNRQDALLCFERHATSKISSDEDLFALKTLGFRGEALASIASVARLSLKTCNSDDGLGQHIQIEGGQVKKVDQIGLPMGTIVDVRNLFFNLPARKKFLRKDQTELGHCADVVSKLALARPDVSFRLLHNDRVLLDLRSERALPERFAALLGRSVLRDMLPLDQVETAGLSLSGLISHPDLNRSSGTHIYTFINGRYIRDRVVQHAVMAGYRQLLMKGRYPVVALFLDIEPAQVDVNVHPTKHEVRFRDQGLVHDFITHSIRRTLKPIDRVAPADDMSNSAVEADPFDVKKYDQPEPTTMNKQHGSRQVREHPEPFIVGDSAPDGGNNAVVEHHPLLTGSTDDQSAQQGILPGTANGFFASLHILGQYHQTYILCQQDNDLLLIDQHAAHERVGFEKLKAFYDGGRVPRQQLLFPEVLDLDYNSAGALADNLAELDRLGFEVEPFGGKSFAVKAVPTLLGSESVVSLVTDVALDLEHFSREGKLSESIDNVLIRMACHGVVRANQALSQEEIKALFADLDQVDFSRHCPHGRPVLTRMTLYEVERLFRRHG